MADAPIEPPKTLKEHLEKLKKGKQDYQGNYEVFEMPDEQKPPEPPARVPYRGIIIAGIVVVVLIALGVAILTMLNTSGSFL